MSWVTPSTQVCRVLLMIMPTGVGKKMDVSLENIENVMEPRWAHFGRKKTLKTSQKVMELMNSEKFRLASSGSQPLL